MAILLRIARIIFFSVHVRLLQRQAGFIFKMLMFKFLQKLLTTVLQGTKVKSMQLIERIKDTLLIILSPRGLCFNEVEVERR